MEYDMNPLQNELPHGQLKVRLQDESGVREVIATVIDAGVLKGSAWLPGIEIAEDSLIAECAISSMMEAGKLFDVWEADPDSDMQERSFTVIQAWSEDLERLELLGATLPPGATIRTEDGYVFRVTDGVIGDGDLAFASMSDIGACFILAEDSPG